jgi:2-methylisocitrate lyase-like PEP mutase family enzyme
MSTFRQLVKTERPLVLPGAHDALSASLIRQAGFKAYFVGGFPVAGVRYGVPDIVIFWACHPYQCWLMQITATAMLRM